MMGAVMPSAVPPRPRLTAQPATGSRLLPGRKLLPLPLRMERSHARRGAQSDRRCILWLVIFLAGYHAGAEDQHDVRATGMLGAEHQRHLNAGQASETVDLHRAAPVRKLWLNTEFGLASRVTSASSIASIKYANYSGSVTFYGSLTSNTTSDPWSTGKALLNLLSYDRDLNFQVGDLQRTLEQHNEFNKIQPTNFQARMDAECRRELYSPTLTDGLTSKLDSRERIAKVVSSSYLSFSGESLNKLLTVRRSGVVAVCYCTVLDVQQLCADPQNWFYAGRLTVRGPLGGQSWVFPTQIVVKIDVQGWGLSSSDKLRIIPATGTCESSNGDPSGDISFKVGCPSTVPPGGCRYATTTESIPLNVRTAATSQVYITGITTSQQQSTLSFSASVQNVLDSNDVITLDVDRIRVNGKALSTMTTAEKFEAYKLAAERPFLDDAAQKYIVGLRVTEVKDSGTGIVDNQAMSVPLGWPSTGSPAFTFLSSQGHWTRRNKEETSAEIKGMTAQDSLKACWGAEDAGNTKYYSQAGEITFAEPPTMKDARISLSTKMSLAVAPIVISFTTGAQRVEYRQFQAAPSQLMLRFLDVDGKLVLRKVGDTPPSGVGPAVFADADEVLEINKKQMICGMLFAELWSSDAEGFPMPAGCYYGKQYKDDQVNGGIEELSYRELFLVFPAGSGLRQNTNYQLVINAKTNSISQGDVLLDLYTMCTGITGCERPYQVFERGGGEASVSTEAEAGFADPGFGTDGVNLQLGDSTHSVLNLSDLNVLQIKLAGGEDQRAITASCLIRLYMWPLTLWSISAGLCSAECIRHSGNEVKQCSGSVFCSPEQVVAGSERRNVVKLQLPVVMDSITGSVMHTIKVTGLQLPSGGYFPSRIGVQLTRPDDTKPSYTTSTGFLMKDAEPGTTTGRLVVAGRSGYGPKPFPNDKLNTLYLRLSFGATVWNVGQSNSAFIDVTLPTGYTCKVLGDGLADYSQLDIFGKLDKNGYYDNSRGYLSVAPEDGSWASSTGETCTYQVNNFNAIFAGTVAYVKVTVDNPGEAMRKTNASNVWKIRLRSKGMLATAPVYNQPEIAFISLAEEQLLGTSDWGGNAVVLAPLEYETLQPTQFRISNTSVTQSGNLHVFFRAAEYIGERGYVVLDAPVGFDFGATCLAGSLSSEYYVFRGTTEEQLRPLRDIGECVGLKYPTTSTTYNRARIMVKGVMDAGKTYGFKIGIVNPATYTTQQHSDWYIWTKDSDMYGIQGSTSTVRFNPNQAALQTNYYHKGFGTYHGKFFDYFNIEVADMTPKSLSSADSTVTVWPLIFQTFTLTSLRITAPPGFTWTQGSFKTTMNMSTADFPEVPLLENGNQLIWKKIEFRSGQTYGFQTKVSVPNVSSAVSSYAFFVELGFNNDIIGDRLMATVIPALPIKALTGCAINYASNLEAFTGNYLEFQFITVTPLYENDGLVIKGDANTAGFAISCPPLLLPGSMIVPSDIRCSTDSDSDGLPKIVLKVAATPMLAGYYAFEMATLNPFHQVPTPGSWTFGTYTNIAEYPASPPVDRALVVPGFAINGPMLDAGLTPISSEQRLSTLRNDRPDQANRLIFQFKLQNPPPNASNLLKLQGPRGFEFAEDCLSSVEISSNAVFGPNTATAWPDEYAEWPSQAAPTACAGDGRFATLAVPSGLLDGVMYVFRIGLIKNPVQTQEWNRWTLDFANESSMPFEGFMIWTFTETQVSPVSLATSPTGANVARTKNPVTIHFRPFNRVNPKCSSCPSGGLLRLFAPSGFELVEENGACYQPILMETGGAVEFTDDLRCEVQLKTKMLLELLGSKAVVSGRDYILIVHVHNPPSTASAASWRLESFSDISMQETVALDESTIPGHDINRVANAWTVNNKYNVTDGKAAVNDVHFNMQFPDALKDGDEIIVQGPKGFNLQSNPDIFSCKSFRYLKDPPPLPNSANPRCMCASSVCTIHFTILELITPAYPANQNIQFAIATENPARTPFLTDNFWKVYHHRNGVVLSSDICPSWGINSQLEDVQIMLVGVNRGAGMMSDISITFTPVSDADSIVMEALSPSGFDFGKAAVALPYVIDQASAKDVLILNRCSIIAGRRTTIRINAVKLGAGGGQTTFNLYTYSDEARAVKMDEQLEFTSGFRLPGRITVAGRELNSMYKEDRQEYPVKSLFQPRVAESAKAVFTLLFSQPASAGSKLRIKCEGEGAFELQTASFLIVKAEQLGTSTQCDLAQGVQQVDNSVVRVTSSEMIATLTPAGADIALQANTPYSVVMWVVPKQGTNTWLFETSDSGQLPTNTNDGMTSGFKPVEQMTAQVYATRSPPKAIIEVTLDVQTGSAVVQKLMVIAPPHFIFPTRCGDMCTAGQALGFTGRRTATIASLSGEPMRKLTGLQMLVQTPDKTPDSVEWFVEGHGITGMTTGWGAAHNGFSVAQMVNSLVSYAGVAGLQAAEIIFTFTLTITVGSQSHIAVEPPSGYSISCLPAATLKQISLPGSQPACTNDPLVLTIDTEMNPGEYAFGVSVNVPSQQPKQNTFNIIVQDSDNHVKDAAYNMPGADIMALPLKSPTFSWTTAEPGKVSTITFGLTFTDDVDTIKALLIKFPSNFAHAVTKPTEVRNLNRRFPVATTYPGGWADTTETDRIKILMDDVQQTIVADQYSWSFPILMPSALPRENVWFLSLCGTSVCREPRGPGVLVSFPITGFRFNEQPPDASKDAASIAPSHAGAELLQGVSLAVGSMLLGVQVRAASH